MNNMNMNFNATTSAASFVGGNSSGGNAMVMSSMNMNMNNMNTMNMNPHQFQLQMQQQQQYQQQQYHDSSFLALQQHPMLAAATAARVSGGFPAPPPRSFPTKLHVMLEDAERNGFQDVVAWQPGGKSFKVLQPTKFASTIMRGYFKQTKYKSFQRQLNIYGFQRIHYGPHKGGYSHPCFIRGLRELCPLIARQSVPNGPSTTNDTAANENNSNNTMDVAAAAIGKVTSNSNSEGTMHSSHNNNNNSDSCVSNTFNDDTMDVAVQKASIVLQAKVSGIDSSAVAIPLEGKKRATTTTSRTAANDNHIAAAATAAEEYSNKNVSEEIFAATAELAFSTNDNDYGTGSFAAFMGMNTKAQVKVAAAAKAASASAAVECYNPNGSVVQILKPDFAVPLFGKKLNLNLNINNTSAAAAAAATISGRDDDTVIRLDGIQERKQRDSYFNNFQQEHQQQQQQQGNNNNNNFSLLDDVNDLDEILSLSGDDDHNIDENMMMMAERSSDAAGADSDDNNNNKDGGNNNKANLPPSGDYVFPWKLHKMLDDAERDNFQHIVSWVEDGAAFKVHKSDDFVKKIMPIYFDQTKYESFRRQLNLYGFARATRGQNRGIYFHQFFLQSDRSLCQNITRPRSTSTGTAATATGGSSGNDNNCNGVMIATPIIKSSMPNMMNLNGIPSEICLV